MEEIKTRVQLPLAREKFALQIEGAYERGGFEGGKQKAIAFEETARNQTSLKDLKRLLADFLPSNKAGWGRPA